MNNFESNNVKKGELLALAQSILARRLNPIAGMRRIVALRFATGDPDNEVFLPIRGMESETEAFPIGDARANFSDGYLEKMDADMKNYLSHAEADIFQACREILATFSCDPGTDQDADPLF
jgi:hypothetical protein